MYLLMNNSAASTIVQPPDRTFRATQRWFIHRFNRPLTTRFNGLSWGKAPRTWQAAQAHFATLSISCANNTMRTRSLRFEILENPLQQFIIDSPWEHHAVQA